VKLKDLWLKEDSIQVGFNGVFPRDLPQSSYSCFNLNDNIFPSGVSALLNCNFGLDSKSLCFIEMSVVCNVFEGF
jgi:hypothetical protein